MIRTTPTNNEVTDVLRLQKRKSAGHDKLTAEMLKDRGSEFLELLTGMFKRAWNEGNVPTNSEIGIILPILKKKDKGDCTN